MNAIQTRLTVYLLACVLALSAVGSLAVYVVFRDRMMAQFDDALRAEARSIAGYFSRDHDGHYEFKPPPGMDSMFRHGNDLDVYCIRKLDGTVVVHAPWIKPQDCPGATRPATQEGFARVHGYRSPHDAGHRHRPKDGWWETSLKPRLESNWRAAWLTFLPASEKPMPVGRFQVAVAAEWEESDELLKQLFWVLVAVSAVAGAATVGLVFWTVRHTLSPLRALADQAGSMDPAHLDKRFSLAEPSRELTPIYGALNQLLDRIADTLRREQRFNSDVAHELRTPVAELRSLTEVAMASAATPGVLAEALEDAHSIAVQMEAMITALLALRRREPAARERLDVVPLLRNAWQPFEAISAGRKLTMSWQMPGEANVLGDQTMLLSVLQNLFQNAANYTAEGGEVACTVAAGKETTEITVRNRPHGLSPDDVSHLFEPFWRKEEARSDGAHVGLGLTLAASFCQAMGGALRAKGGDWLAFTITLPSAAPGYTAP